MTRGKLAAIATAPATRLAVTRVLIGGYTVAKFARTRSGNKQIVRQDQKHFQPVGPVRVLRQPLKPCVADALNDATLASSVPMTLGFRHRLIGPLHSALLTWTLSYGNSWSMVYHVDNTLVAQTLVLGASRATDAVSLDALRHLGRQAPEHPRYAWSLALMKSAGTIPYLLAGIAKLGQQQGWTWAKGDAMRRHVAVDVVRKEINGSKPAPAAALLYPHRRLFTLAAIGTLILELGAPLALLNNRLGRLWATAMFGMHWGVKFVMDIRFDYQLFGASFAPWFRVEKLLPSYWRR
jgi:hypothetical protein